MDIFCTVVRAPIEPDQCIVFTLAYTTRVCDADAEAGQNPGSDGLLDIRQT